METLFQTHNTHFATTTTGPDVVATFVHMKRMVTSSDIFVVPAEKNGFCKDGTETLLQMSMSITNLSITTLFPCSVVFKYRTRGHYVKWRDIGQAGGLRRGDQVVWPRCIGYWHHAIVETVNDDGTINVIEWDFNKIHRGVRKKWDLFVNCCCSPMYKVIYPDEVTQQNPPDLVLSRARALLDLEGYNLFTDNCEHFATFCKTGCHQSGQIFQLRVSLHGWCRRFLLSLIHIAFIVSLSESLENWLGKAKEWFGAILLIATEIVHLIIVVLVIYLVDTTRTSFKERQPPECSKTCRCASAKAAFQSFSLLLFAILFSVFLKDLFIEENWTELLDTFVEISLGIIGGGVGNLVGFWFSYCCCCCCRNSAPEQHQPGGDPRPLGTGRYERLQNNNEHDA